MQTNNTVSRFVFYLLLLLVALYPFANIISVCLFQNLEQTWYVPAYLSVSILITSSVILLISIKNAVYKKTVKISLLFVLCVYVFILFVLDLHAAESIYTSLTSYYPIVFLLVTLQAYAHANLSIVTCSAKNHQSESRTKVAASVILISGLGVVLFGLYERFYISNEDFEMYSFYSLIGESKGLIYTGLPENLYSFMQGFEFRRMVSIFGEPLYLAYFLYPIFCLAFMIYVFLRSKWCGVISIILFVGICLTISRYAIICSLIIFFVLAYMRSVNPKMLIVCVVCGLILASPFLIYLSMKAALYDASFNGHLNSFVDSIEYIGIKGLIFPSTDTVINNYLSQTQGKSQFTESGLLLIMSTIGFFPFLILSSVVFLYVVKSVNALRLFHFNCLSGNPYKFIFLASFQISFIGFLFTAILSPHMFTFQQSAFILQLAALAVIL